MYPFGDMEPSLLEDMSPFLDVIWEKTWSAGLLTYLNQQMVTQPCMSHVNTQVGYHGQHENNFAYNTSKH